METTTAIMTSNFEIGNKFQLVTTRYEGWRYKGRSGVKFYDVHTLVAVVSVTEKAVKFQRLIDNLEIWLPKSVLTVGTTQVRISKWFENHNILKWNKPKQ